MFCALTCEKYWSSYLNLQRIQNIRLFLDASPWTSPHPFSLCQTWTMAISDSEIHSLSGDPRMARKRAPVYNFHRNQKFFLCSRWVSCAWEGPCETALLQLSVSESLAKSFPHLPRVESFPSCGLCSLPHEPPVRSDGELQKKLFSSYLQSGNATQDPQQISRLAFNALRHVQPFISWIMTLMNGV